MNAISFSLPDVNMNGTAVLRETTLSSDIACHVSRQDDATREMPAPFETILRHQARSAKREEPDPRVDRDDSRRDEAVPLMTVEKQGAQAAPQPAVSPSASACASEATFAAMTEPAVCLPSRDAGGWAAVENLTTVLTSQVAGGLPAAAEPATVLASQTAVGLPAATDPTTVLTSQNAGGLPETAEPRMAQSPEDEGGWDVPQVIEASDQSLAGRSLAVPEGAWGAGRPDLARRDGAAALASNPWRPLQHPDLTEPSPVLETLSPTMLSLGRDAKTDLRELASLFPISRDPWGHQQGQERSAADVRERGVTMLVMGNTTTLDSRESASVRPVADQLATRLVAWADVMSTEGRTVFHLRLEPPELGSVRVQLSATAGTISAKFIASNEAAGQILQSQLHELRESLAKLGVSCASLDVSYGQGGSQGTAQQRELQPYPWHDNTPAVQDQQLVVWQRRSRPAALIDVLV